MAFAAKTLPFGTRSRNNINTAARTQPLDFVITPGHHQRLRTLFENKSANHTNPIAVRAKTRYPSFVNRPGVTIAHTSLTAPNALESAKALKTLLHILLARTSRQPPSIVFEVTT
jgi:hypothetical protein